MAELCCVCLRLSEDGSTFHTNSIMKSLPLHKLIEFCIGIKLNPSQNQHICNECVMNTNQFYLFKKRIIDIQESRPTDTEPRVRKRLRFDDADVEQKDTNVDSPKKVKFGKGNEGTQNVSGASFGFSSSKAKVAETAVQKARNLFGEDFSDLRSNAPCSDFKACNKGFKTIDTNAMAPGASSKPPSSVGFSTARGSSIKISEENLQKYAQTLKDVTKTVAAEYHHDGADDEPNLKEKATPLNKVKNQSKVFATSTPNPSSLNAPKMCPPVTPINNVSLDEGDSLDDGWMDSLGGLLDNLSPQHSKNKSTNINISTASAAGINVLNICEKVKLGREHALIEQQADCIKKRHPIRPKHGSLMVNKQRSDTLKLCDLGTPKKYQREELERLGVLPNVIDLNIDNVLQFKFDMWKYHTVDLCQMNIEGIDMQDEMKLIMDGNSRVGLKEITSAFLHCPSVDPKLVPDHWIRNEFKFILLKLAGYERSFPHVFAGKRLTPENVSQKNSSTFNLPIFRNLIKKGLN